MIGFGHMSRRGAGGMKAAAALLALASLAACSAGNIWGSQPDAAAAPPRPADAAVSTPPPVDLAGRWQLSAAAGGACFMTFGVAQNATAAPGTAPQGPIAPEGGCPGNFFMSRKWTFERDALIIHDFKGRPLAHLSYLGGHFEGLDKGGGALTLSKQQ